MLSKSEFSRIHRFAFAMFAIGLFLPTITAAQEPEVEKQPEVYTEDPTDPKLVDEKKKTYKDWEREKDNIINKGMKDESLSVKLPQIKKRFTGWYDGLLFAQMTQQQYRKSLPALRAEYLQEQSTCGKRNPQALKVLNEFTLKKMIHIADGKNKYHPAVRHNAVMILGELNKMVGKTSRIPDVPFYEVLNPAIGKGLLSIATSAKQHPAVRVAAMSGIVRHVKSIKPVEASPSIPAGMRIRPKQVSDITTAMTDLLTKSEITDTLSADGKTWVMMMAADVLGELGSPGIANLNVKALATMIGNKEVGVSARSAGARALSKISFSNLAAADAKKLCGDLGLLARDILMDELNRSEKYRSKQTSTNTVRYFTEGVKLGLVGADGKGGIASKASGSQKLCTDLAAKLQPLLDDENVGITDQANAIHTWLLTNKFITVKTEDSDDKSDSGTSGKKKPSDGEFDLE